MNCFNHNDLVAVGACQNCGVGLCNECVSNAVKIENKPICKSCDLTRVESYIAELREELSKIKVKKIIWSVILALGCIALLSHLVVGTPFSIGQYFFACFFWAFAGFTERAQRRLEFENSAAGIRAKFDEEREYRDNTIWVTWAFKFAFFLIRGAFFPIFYANLMLFGTKKIQNEPKECEAYKDSL